MSYRLPPLKGLRAFDAAARHLSFKLAANELCVTPGAVSQQVKALEQKLGMELFERLPNGLVLTPQAETYQAATARAFNIISEATEALAPAMKDRPLRLGVSAELVGHQETEDALSLIRSAGVNLRVPATMQTVQEGAVDGLIRPYLARHTQLALEHFHVHGLMEQLTLAIRPGLAGCIEHRHVMSILRNLS